MNNLRNTSLGTGIHFQTQNVPFVVISFSIKGQTLSSLADLDKYLLGHHGGLLKPIRPVSAYVVGSADSRNADEKPVLRRERTFDMDPKPSTSKLVEVNIDVPNNQNDVKGSNHDPDEDDQDAAGGPTLQMFQQQRLYHTMRLKREIAKLEKMEKEIAQKTAEIGPEPKPRQCWTQTSNPSSRPSSSSSSIMSNTPRRPTRRKDESKTTFKNLHQNEGQQSKFKVQRTSDNQTQSNMSSSWFIPGMLMFNM